MQGLVGIAAGGEIYFDLPIAMVVDGTMLRGRIARPEFFAGQVDDRLVQIANTANIKVHGPEGSDQQEHAGQIREVLSKSLSAAFRDMVAAYRKREKEARDNLERALGTNDTWDPVHPPSIDDLSDKLAKDLLIATAPFTTLALEQAEIYVGGSWQALGVVRVALAHIGAWWLPTA